LNLFICLNPFLTFFLLIESCGINKQIKLNPMLDSFQKKENESFVKDDDTIPKNVLKIIKYYDEIVDFNDNKLVFKDGSTMVYDDGKEKDWKEKLTNPDIEDMFYWVYDVNIDTPKQFSNPGRIRNESFFKKIYGVSKGAVQKELVPITWCPKLINTTIWVTKRNNVHLAFQALSSELDNHPEFKLYLKDVGGIFSWRNIKGTNRLSMHSFGATIDINVTMSNYWIWDCKCTNDDVKLKYRNRIPLALVSIFEKKGFIWGGRWYNYDTMHFEYRPELVLN